MAVLKVIRASAGSGKTFRLTTEYLALLYHDPDYFRHILAVTFTNKATEEMKTRIIRELWLLAEERPSDQLAPLAELTGLSEKTIRGKSQTILKKILHQYDRFSISTIDSFFQRIIRAFTHELGIQGGYSIELDVETVISLLVDRLLGKLEKDRSLLTWLYRYAESLIEQGENWNFRGSLVRLGREIFREELRQQLDSMMDRFSDRDFLGKYQSSLSAMLAGRRNAYRAIGLEAVGLIESSGLEINDFSGKSRGPAGFLYRISGGDFREPGITVREASLHAEKWYRSGSPEAGRIKAVCEAGLLDCMRRLVQFYDDHRKEMATAEQVLKNLFTLGILADLFRLVSDYCNEHNVFLLPEASSFLHQIIRDNDTPFIYEKAGSWYHHFMIDEFQDTSRLQWNNFKPLISNSLSLDFDNLLVGDVKQSIYRWRNSNWEILAGEITKEYHHDDLKIMSLQKNYRSGQRIVSFNNAFFTLASDMLQHHLGEIMKETGNEEMENGGISLRDIYTDAGQEQGKPEIDAGCVQVDLIPADENAALDEQVSERLIRQICELRELGYAAGQIAVITRRNAEAEHLAEALMNYRHAHPDDVNAFDVISDEALQLHSSATVVFLVALLRYLARPEDKLNRYHAASDFINYTGRREMKDGFASPEAAVEPDEDYFTRLMPAAFLELADSPGGISLTETVEQLIAIFDLERFTGEIAYIQAFQDLVLEYSRKYAPDLTGFLAYWDETGSAKSVAAPASQDAVRILTIHKSKGLEFDIVIIPYCNWALDSGKNNILWCDATKIPGCELEVVPVMYSSKLKDTWFAGAYYAEMQKQYVDSLNLLYVAFTRAKKGLFIYCSKEKEGKLQTVADLVMQVLASDRIAAPGHKPILAFEDHFRLPGESFVYGSLPEPGKQIITRGTRQLEMEHVRAKEDGKISRRLRVAFQGNLYLEATEGQLVRPVNHGRIMHEVFSRIGDAGDVSSSLESLCLEGKIDLRTKDELLIKIGDLLKDIQVLSWFSGDWKVLNENEIILPGGEIRRPDRVLIKEERAIVIDFKFGRNVQASDRGQVRNYAGMISEMGYSHVEGYLWYVELEKVIQVA